MANSNKTKTLNVVKVIDLPFHENTAFKFTQNGLVISSGLNVKPEIAKVIFANPELFAGKLFKGEKMQIYKRAASIPSGYICRNSVIMVQKQIIADVQEDLKRANNLIKWH